MGEAARHDAGHPVTPEGRPEPATLGDLYEQLAAVEAQGPGIGRFVPGEGREGALLAFVGEQPGDQEDREGRPFVGPAGKLLDQALEEAGIPRAETFVTNAVKRFHFQERGKRRLHRKPTGPEILRERWWLERELALVHPQVVVALGATALQALARRALPVNASRGPMRFPAGLAGYVTIHPSAILRLREREERAAAFSGLVADLSKAASLASTAAA